MTRCRWKLLALASLTAAVGLGLGACGTAPYVDSRREAGQRVPVGASSADMVAICYSSQSATPEQVHRLAESECAKTGRVPLLAEHRVWSCTLFAPTRAFYRCIAKPSKP